MDKITIFIIGIVILGGLVFFFFQARPFAGPSQPVEVPEGIVLFFGDGCPHCKRVEEFLVGNKIEEKIDFVIKEVWNNRRNLEMLKEVAKRCEATGSSVGVPFLYDGESCYVGELNVIKFFEKKAGIE